jgi:hypothetical protein
LLYLKDGDPPTIECPPRRWIPLDFDGVNVPHGLGAPDRLVEAGYHIRDCLLPSPFRGVCCVAAATASTGRKGPGVARLRLFFVLPEAADNDALIQWADDLSRREPGLRLDPSVMLAMQPIYTARPVWKGCSDIVPSWGRVAVLDGSVDTVAIDLPRVRRTKSRSPSAPKIVCDDIPAELLDMAAEDEGQGVVALDTSNKAWGAIKRAFSALDGCSTGRRHRTMTKVGWEFARLVNEGEMPKRLAVRAFLTAAKGIDNSDGEYSRALIKRRLRDAFADVGRR